MGLIDDEQCDILLGGCAVEASFEDGVLLNWLCNAIRPTEISILWVADNHMSVNVFLQATMMSTCLQAYVFIPMDEAGPLRSIGWYCAASNSVWGIFSGLSSSSVAEKAIAWASSVIVMSFFNSMKAKIMHRVFAVLLS